MSVMVPLEELRSELEHRSNAAYLLTVRDDGRPHCVAVTLEWRGDELVMGAGTTSAHNAAARRQVTLLSPPAAGLAPRGVGSADDPQPGYSLIVDGEVPAPFAPGAAGGEVTVRPTHAVLHRPAVSPAGGRLHDCVPVLDEAT